MFIPETDFWLRNKTENKTLAVSFRQTVAISQNAGLAQLPSGNRLLEETHISSQKDLE